MRMKDTNEEKWNKSYVKKKKNASQFGNIANRRSLREDLMLITRGFRVLYEVCPQNFIWKTISCIVFQIAPYFTLYLSSLIINALASGFPHRNVWILAAVTVVGQFLINILIHLANQKTEELEDIDFNLNELYMLKVQCRMQYKHLENPEIVQLRQRIRDFSNFGGYGLRKLYWSYGTFISAVVNVFFSVSLIVVLLIGKSDKNLEGFFLFINHPFSALILVVLIIINLVAQMVNIYYFEPKYTKIWSDFNVQSARCNGYLQFNADTIIMGATELSLKRCNDVLVKTGYLRENLLNRIESSVVSHILKATVNLALYIYVGAKVYIGALEIGSFVLYTGMIDRFVAAVSDMGACFSTMRQNNDYLVELFRFLDLPDEMYHGTLSVEKREDNKFDIEFRNVSFRYPGSDTYALENVSFKFNIGERVAFVGMNGSGKTTFIKLLCRLYDPTEGQILLKGIDISKYDYAQYLKLFSVVFQDIFLFSFPLGENISAQKDYDVQKVKKCLDKVGFGNKLSALERGLNTPIGFMYEDGGVEFSEGEEQKIVLARALYKDAPYFILDEPTSALDPIAESEVYNSFDQIMNGKTVIYISHRLSSCCFADKIVVFHEGKIVQQGKHEFLKNDKAGIYYELWNAQAKYYKEKVVE